MENRPLRGGFGDVFRRVSGDNGGQAICVAGRKSNKPRKRFLKGKQMFVGSVSRKKISWQEGTKESGFLAFRRCGAELRRGSDLSCRGGGAMKKGKPSESKPAFSMGYYEVKRYIRARCIANSTFGKFQSG